ncbi:hypothetical protein NP233_g3130 [Leucocoprinus birnbaumii]|uniref:Uncharacterized protein n=1 Tax=Leucocoprinus birnbaumii TaxID=56174 RepID=A0AAD5VZN5_9AGAR|nr:hypothetical protein NP233_g3130 [Leucocoprinus birnbaumii]
MSLDQNLFTLQFTPHKEYTNVIDLVDPSGVVHYRKQRVASPEYKIEVYDPLSESLLITATAPSATSKTKILELKNPTHIVEMKYTGTISFRWGFRWEEHDFEWKREECFMLRKPDPPVLVAVTKEPSSKLKTSTVQILDYNLNRFDINDRKGLEILILTALMTFSDSNEAQRAPAANPPAAVAKETKPTPSNDTAPSSSEAAPSVPKPPPKPPVKTGVDRIAELQAVRGEYNEVTVEDEGSVDDYAQYCSNLLNDDAMLFVTVKSAEAVHVPKVLQVVEETKRIRHKAGLSDEEELHQYVLYDTKPEKKGPRIINLDDNDKDKNKKYKPPNSLTIHLSKIPMPELQPKAQQGSDGKKARAPSPPSAQVSSSKSKSGKNKLSRPSKDTLSHPSVNHPNKPQYKPPSPKHTAPQFIAPHHGQPGAMNSRPPPPSPSTRPYPASPGPYSAPGHPPPWAQPPPGGQNTSQPKPGGVSGLFDRFRR